MIRKLAMDGKALWEGTPRIPAQEARMLPMMMGRAARLTARSQRSLATEAPSKAAKAIIEMEAWENHSRHSYAHHSSHIEGLGLAGLLSGVMLVCLAPAISYALAPAKAGDH